LGIDLGATIVTVPTALAQRVLAQPVPPEQVVTEAIETWLLKRVQTSEATSERARIHAAILKTGLVEPMGDVWIPLMTRAARLSHVEIQQKMAGKPPLSDLIIAERREGRS